MRLHTGRRLLSLEVRLRRGAIVDPEDPFDDIRQLGRHGERARPTTIRAAVVLLLLDRGSERGLESRRRSG